RFSRDWSSDVCSSDLRTIPEGPRSWVILGLLSLSASMLPPMLAAGLVVGAYFVGSICFGLVLAGRAGIELREVGSGNVGATNAGRALGAGAGRIVMALDFAKGLVPMLAASALDGRPLVLVAVGVAAVIGH